MGLFRYSPAQDSPRHPTTSYTASRTGHLATRKLTQDISVDVAIIGGGLVGISAALALREQDLTVAVLEAREIGWGAAGRAAGQVSPHATKLEPWQVLETYGPNFGPRLNAAGAGAPDLIRDLGRLYDFDPEIMTGGIVSAAHTEVALQRFQKRSDYWQREGADVAMLDRREVAEVLGCKGYLGGIIDRRGIAISPLALILGLARAAIKRDVAVYEGAQVDAMTPAPSGGWLLKAAGLRVEAGKVLICTNAYSGSLWPGLKQTIIPVRSYLFCTKPLAPEIAAHILPGAVAFNDSQHLIKGARRLPGNRIQFSGRMPSFGAERPPNLAAEAERIRGLFPQLGKVEIDAWWSGWVTRGISDGWRLHELGPNVYSAIACNGRGLAMGPIVGRELAKLATGTPRDELLLPISPLQTIFGHVFHRPFAELTVRYMSWKDRREIRRNAQSWSEASTNPAGEHQ